jgi:hypothetical protein
MTMFYVLSYIKIVKICIALCQYDDIYVEGNDVMIVV